jgi:hypothetical protein
VYRYYPMRFVYEMVEVILARLILDDHKGTKNRLRFVGKGVDADDAVALAPRVSPAVKPLAHTGGKTMARCAASDVLRARVLFLSDYDICYSKT